MANRSLAISISVLIFLWVLPLSNLALHLRQVQVMSARTSSASFIALTSFSAFLFRSGFEKRNQNTKIEIIETMKTNSGVTFRPPFGLRSIRSKLHLDTFGCIVR